MEERDEHGRRPLWEDHELDCYKQTPADWARPSKEHKPGQVMAYYDSARKKIEELCPWTKKIEEMQHIKLSPDQEAACNID